jgi:RNA polymerase sigma-70 factor (ECF subfamily)
MTEDTEIYHVCITDKERGFRLLMTKYQELIYHYIRRMVVSHHDAEDVTQETFIRVYRSIHKFRNDSALGTWIYRIATNECIRFLSRKNKMTVSAESVNSELINSLKASDYIDYDDVVVVKFQEAILHLSDKQRIVFNLRYYDDLDYNQISKITDTKVDTLKVEYHIAKDKIMNYMTKE